MSTAAQKFNYLQQVQATMTGLGQLVERARTLQEIHADRGYDSGAAETAVTDDDLASFGVIQYDLGAAVNLLQALADLVNNTPVNHATVNKWRQI